MPFIILRQDLTTMHVDAIVNAANIQLKMGGGLSGAIFKAAGAPRLRKACDALAPIATSDAVITPGFDLPARYIIHTAGPIYAHHTPEQSEALLFAAYTNCLRLAHAHHLHSIAFPLLSSGIYGYPKQEALAVATRAIQTFLLTHDMHIYLAVFDKTAFEISQQHLGNLAAYIDDHYVAQRQVPRRKLLDFEERAFPAAPPCDGEEDLAADRDAHINALQDFAYKSKAAHPCPRLPQLDEHISNLDEPFNTALFRLIDAKGTTDVDVYKRANIDRKLFSKIRSTKNYIPHKRTAIALAIALRLSLEETATLLARAGYALSHSQTFDVIIQYFITHGIYDIFQINETLFYYDLPLLGS